MAPDLPVGGQGFRTGSSGAKKDSHQFVIVNRKLCWPFKPTPFYLWSERGQHCMPIDLSWAWVPLKWLANKAIDFVWKKRAEERERKKLEASSRAQFLGAIYEDLKPALSEYEDWIVKVLKTFSPDRDGILRSGYLDEEWITKVQKTIRELVDGNNIHPFYRTFYRYDADLVHFRSAILEMLGWHRSILQWLDSFIKNYDGIKKRLGPIESHVELDRRLSINQKLIRALLELANQFGQLVHYECTIPLGVDPLSISNPSRLAIFIRDYFGNYSILNRMIVNPELAESETFGEADKRAVDLRKKIYIQVQQSMPQFKDAVAAFRNRILNEEMAAHKDRLDYFTTLFHLNEDVDAK